MDLDNRILKSVETLVKPVYDGLINWEHGWPHIVDVRKRASKLANAEGVNSTLCKIVDYCHDLGRFFEEKGDIDNSLERCKDHARLSIEPTVNILNAIGIKGNTFNYIVEAVAIHSYFFYDGKNIFAKILRDSDKCGALGPLGLLRTAKFHLGEDFVNPEEILTNYGNDSKIEQLANQTLKLIKQNPDLSKKYSETGLKKVLEWEEKRMFHLDSTYVLFAEDIEYTKKIKDFLLSD